MSLRNKPLTVFIGYDERQQEAYETCAYSIRKHNTDVSIYPLNHRELRKLGFNRPWIVEGETGRYLDVNDCKNFSTQFSHSRFMTPLVARRLGCDGLAMFVDSDFVFTTDVDEIKDDLCSPFDAMWVVQHDYKPKNAVKMDNQLQTSYNKKLWSSLMVFNLDVDHIDLDTINTMDGKDLHDLEPWQKRTIGSIPERWNFIPGHSKGRYSAVHFTEGTPLMPGYEQTELAEVFIRYYREMMQDKYKRITDGRNRS